MAKKKAEYTEILLRQGLVSPEQINEAKQMAKESGIKLPDALVRLGYATGEDVTRAIAEQNGLTYVNVDEVNIPPVGHRIGARVGRAGKRRPPPFGGRWPLDDHHQRPLGHRHGR